MGILHLLSETFSKLFEFLSEVPISKSYDQNKFPLVSLKEKREKIAIFAISFLAFIDENLILLFTLGKYTTDIRVKTLNFREILIKFHQFSPRKTRKMHFW